MPDRNLHQVSILNREEVKLKGVIKVETFDDEEIILETNMGPLALRGENLHISHLNLETGELAAVGTVKSLQYLEQGMKTAKGKGKSVIKRLMK